MGKLDSMLKPCFCGGKRTIECKTHTAGMGEGYTNWEMTCDKCHGLWTLSADNFYGSTPHTELEDIKIWNDMVTEAAEEMVELKIKYDKAMIHTLVEENEKLKADNKILAENCLKDLLALAIMDVPHGICITEGKEVDTVKPLSPAHKMCKDCAKSKILNDGFEGYGLVCSRFGRMAVNPDFYCADFEKQGEKND